MPTDRDDPLTIQEYYDHYLDRCCSASRHYKEDLNKLMLWLGSVFVGVVVVTGIFGALEDGGLVFSLLHVLIFHAVFAVFWLFYLHKKLRAEMFLRIGMAVETAFARRLGRGKGEAIPSFFDLEEYYPQESCIRKLSLSRLAGYLLVLLYLLMVICPVISGDFSVEGFSLNFAPLIGLLVFAAIIVGGQVLYRAEKKRVMRTIDERWQSEIEKAQPAAPGDKK